MPLPPALLARLKKRGIVTGDAGATKVVATPTPAAEPVVAAAAEPVSTHTGEFIIGPPLSLTHVFKFHQTRSELRRNSIRSIADVRQETASGVCLVFNYLVKL